MDMLNRKRVEKDSLGTLELPKDSNYGIYTARVLDNFQISGVKIPELFLINYIKSKKCYALVHKNVKKLDSKKALAIIWACEELLKMNRESFIENFPINIFQSGGGTSTNMMVNEVIANLANEHLGETKGTYSPIHPNDHVNMSQSSNDTFPGIVKITCVMQLEKLLDEIEKTEDVLSKKAREFEKIEKVGRTHLQDALKITSGNEFSAFYQTLKKNREFLLQTKTFLLELPFGATALGSMQNISPHIRREIIALLSREFKQKFTEPLNYFESTSSSGDMNKISLTLSSLASDLIKISTDLRLLSSGPKAGLNEIVLPAVQAGSSIMPGKINPSILECLEMICFRVLGNSRTIEIATISAQLQLQAFMPIIGFSLFESFEILTNGIEMFREKCLAEIKLDRNEIKKYLDNSFVYATEYTEDLGYAKIAELVKKAYQENKNLRDLIEAEKNQKNLPKAT